MRISDTVCKTKLAKLRVKKGWSQKTLSKKCGIGISTINQLEHKYLKIENSQLSTLYLLMKNLDCSLTDLLEDKKMIEFFKENI